MSFLLDPCRAGANLVPMDWTAFAIFLAAAATAGATGTFFSPGTWYEALVKPGFTPPPLAFPIVWTTLYVLMALAAARIAPKEANGTALAFWALQIALNTLWTPVFFGAHRIGAALVIIVLMWLAIAATTWAFFALDRWAGALMVPYLAWVSLATALNLAIWRLNPA